LRRTLMICIIAALAALPLMAGAQQSGTMTPTYEEEQTKGHLMPKDAHPNQSSSEGPSYLGASWLTHQLPRAAHAPAGHLFPTCLSF